MFPTPEKSLSSPVLSMSSLDSFGQAHFHYSIPLLIGLNVLFSYSCQFITWWNTLSVSLRTGLHTWWFCQLLSTWELLHRFFVCSLSSLNRSLINNLLPWSCHHLKPLHHHIHKVITDQLHFHHTVALPHCSPWWAATVSNSRAITAYDRRHRNTNCYWFLSPSAAKHRRVVSDQ